MKHLKIVLIAIMMVALAGCASNRKVSEAKNNPTLIAYIQAAGRLKELVRSGRVPGFNPEDHASVISPRLSSADTASVEYPIQVCLQADRAGELGAIYWILLEKVTANSEWDIVEVWKTDERAQNGHYLLKAPDAGESRPIE
jgi:hypothetical protein